MKKTTILLLILSLFMLMGGSPTPAQAGPKETVFNTSTIYDFGSSNYGVTVATGTTYIDAWKCTGNGATFKILAGTTMSAAVSDQTYTPATAPTSAWLDWRGINTSGLGGVFGDPGLYEGLYSTGGWILKSSTKAAGTICTVVTHQ